MLYIVIGLLLIMVIIFGVSSGMQSFATAQQAQATIEVAQVAQVSAWGNLVTILTIAMLVVVTVALVAAVLYFLYKRSTLNGKQSVEVVGRPITEARPQGQISMNELTQLMMLDVLRSMRSSTPPASLPSGNGSGPHDDEPLQWLK
jgi:flagellar basal body-associated protein FliL